MCVDRSGVLVRVTLFLHVYIHAHVRAYIEVFEKPRKNGTRGL